MVLAVSFIRVLQQNACAAHTMYKKPHPVLYVLIWKFNNFTLMDVKTFNWQFVCCSSVHQHLEYYKLVCSLYKYMLISYRNLPRHHKNVLAFLSGHWLNKKHLQIKLCRTLSAGKNTHLTIFQYSMIDSSDRAQCKYRSACRTCIGERTAGHSAVRDSRPYQLLNLCLLSSAGRSADW